MNTLVLFLMLAAVTAAIRRTNRTRPAAPVCAACGNPPARGDCPTGPGWRCPSCVTRHARTASLALTAALDRQAARRRAVAQAAVAEAERIAHRHTVVRVGTVTPGPRGPVFDGWVFQDPRISVGAAPSDARALPLSGFYRPGEPICGWTPQELHELAHGAACRCLNS